MSHCTPTIASRSSLSTPVPAVVDPAPEGAERMAAEQEFGAAMQRYKQWSGRQFPTWSEVLEVLKGLGYRKANQIPPPRE